MPSKPFTDFGFQGVEFTKALLESSDYNASSLRNLAQPGVPSRKAALAHDVAERLGQGQLDPQRVIDAYAAQAKTWLTLRLGPFANAPQLPDAARLLFEFGADGWYGPVRPADAQDETWYLHVTRVPTPHKDYPEAAVRWVVSAQVARGFVALHWDGFTHPTAPGKAPSQFAFWEYVPDLLHSLGELLGASWHVPQLHQLVLHSLWDRYLNHAQYIWRHLRIRAESRGVVLNASSTAVAEINVHGLEALTAALTDASLAALGLDLSSVSKDAVEAALLRTLIQEWGTNSYEFSLDLREPSGEVQKVFRAHCYFGLRPLLHTQDSLQHLKCYASYGGGQAALRFLLEHL
jgi:hypothetical protein